MPKIMNIEKRSRLFNIKNLVVTKVIYGEGSY